MRRALARLDLIDARSPDPWRGWQPVPRPRRRAASRTVAICLIGAAAVYLLYDLKGVAPAALAAGGVRPPLPRDAKPSPLGTPQPLTQRDGTFRFEKTQGAFTDQPVTYDPCRPIHVVVNNAQAPRGSDRLLTEAIGRVHAATGLVFVIDGVTTERPTVHRATTDGSRYGNEWSPVLVAWTDDHVISQLRGDVAGLGGSAFQTGDASGRWRYVSGFVYLDGPAIKEILSRPDGWAESRAIVMHEFGHLVGLAHVNSANELMSPRGHPGLTEFGPGDLTGLSELGTGPCFFN